MFALGVIISIGAAVFFAALGIFSLWGGTQALTREVPREFVRAAASPAQRVATIALVAIPLIITAFFGLLAAGRFLQIAFGLG